MGLSFLCMFQVLEGSPWLQSRRLSVLAVMDPSGEGATTFTMRTSVRRPRVEAEITKVSTILAASKRRIEIVVS